MPGQLQGRAVQLLVEVSHSCLHLPQPVLCEDGMGEWESGGMSAAGHPMVLLAGT